MLTTPIHEAARTRRHASRARALLLFMPLCLSCQGGSDAKAPSADESPPKLESKQQALGSDDYKALILGDGAVGYWRLAELSGTEVRDEVTAPNIPNHGAFRGTYPDTPLPYLNQPGAVAGNPAAMFFASNSSTHTPVQQSNWAEIPDNPNQKPANKRISIEFWFNVTPAAFNPGTWSSLVSKTTNGHLNGYGFYTHSGQINFYMGDRTKKIAVPFSYSTRMHHIVGTYDGATMRLYYDGEPAGSLPFAGAFATDAPLRFGWVPGTLSFGGQIDDVALYNDVLDIETIRTHYRGATESRSGPEPVIKQFVLYADRSVRTGMNVGVYGGSVGVASTLSSSSDAQLTVGATNRLDPTRPTFAPSIALSSKDSVGDLYTNWVTNAGGFAGDVNPYPSTMPRLPVAPAATPGTTDLTVPRGQSITVDAGPYRNVTVNGTLTLRAGTYDMASLVMGANARLFTEQASSAELHVAGGINIGGGSYVQSPVLPARSLTIYTSASDAANGAAALSIGKAVQIHAVLVAPHGTIAIQNSTRVVGALGASSITVADSIQIGYESGLPDPSDSREFCASQVPRATNGDPLDKAAEVALAKCAGATGCDATLTGVANFDQRSAALKYVAKQLTPGEFLAIARDRGRKTRRARIDTSWMNAYCAGDADSDLVPDDRDQCAGTPPLTPTTDVGCTDNTVNQSRPREMIDKVLEKWGLTHDSKCDGAPALNPPSLTGYCEQFPASAITVALRPPTQPEGCGVWYQVRVEVYNHMGGIVREAKEMTFAPNQVGTSLANPPGNPGDVRLDIPIQDRHELNTKVWVRAMNASGQASAWSAPTRFTFKVCAQ